MLKDIYGGFLAAGKDKPQQIDMESILKEIFEGKVKDGTFSEALFEAHYLQLNKGVEIGFADADQLDDLLGELTDNVAVFSAFKSYRQTGELKAQLVDDDGKRRTFKDFKNAVQPLNDNYNSEWLRAEYNLAVRQARSAVQWKQFEADRELYPNLEYVGSLAAEPRQEHKRYYGIIKPLDDPFWNTAMPPNGWGCKCSVRQSDAEPTDDEIEAPKAMAGIAGNAGKTGQVFSNTHPYVQDTTPAQRKQIQNQLERAGFVQGFEEVYSDKSSGGSISVHRLVDRSADDYNDVLSCCKFFAKQGKKTQVLPAVHYRDPMYQELFGELDGTPYEGKCPDFKVAGNFFELESFTGEVNKRKTSNMLSRGLKQSPYLVIADSGATDHYLLRLINERIRNGVEVKEVYVQKGNKLVQVY